MHADDLVRKTFDKIVVFFSFVLWLLRFPLVAAIDVFVSSIFFRILKITPPYLSLIPTRYRSPDNKVLHQKLSEYFIDKIRK